MNVFYQIFLAWLRREDFHCPWGTSHGKTLAVSVEDRLRCHRNDGWDIGQDPFLDQDVDRATMVAWLYKNERAGVYCSPPWTRNYSRAVWLHLRKHGSQYPNHPIISEKSFDLWDEWMANGGKEYEEKYMRPIAKFDPIEHDLREIEAKLVVDIARCMNLHHETPKIAAENISKAVQMHAPWNGKRTCPVVGMHEEQCPQCGGELECDEVDVGVGAMRGPPGCPACHWTPPPSVLTGGLYESPSGTSPTGRTVEEQPAKQNITPKSGKWTVFTNKALK